MTSIPELTWRRLGFLHLHRTPTAHLGDRQSPLAQRSPELSRTALEFRVLPNIRFEWLGLNQEKTAQLQDQLERNNPYYRIPPAVLSVWCSENEYGILFGFFRSANEHLSKSNEDEGRSPLTVIGCRDRENGSKGSVDKNQYGFVIAAPVNTPYEEYAYATQDLFSLVNAVLRKLNAPTIPPIPENLY